MVEWITKMQKKPRKHQYHWKDSTIIKRQRKRREQLNQKAMNAGYQSWSTYETAVLNGTQLIPLNEGDSSDEPDINPWLLSHEEADRAAAHPGVQENNMLDPERSKIMQEVDRIYHINQTSEGRINCIADYIVRLLEASASSTCAHENMTPVLPSFAECNDCGVMVRR